LAAKDLILVLEFPIFDYENEDDDEDDFGDGAAPRWVQLRFSVLHRMLSAQSPVVPPPHYKLFAAL
jgi:hypothetical protein